MDDLAIVAATIADLDVLDEIEQHSFKGAWPRATWRDELDRGWAYVELARLAGHARAYCDYWVVAGEVHILAIATHPDFRGRGIGKRLLEHALARGRSERCTLATLEVRRSNVPAIALYERAGFRTVHVRKGYYQGDGEDALVMLLDL
ncbi:MAG: rimI [Myxococcales bacterium]|nr:rimI [Myxococcales bacterium]